MKHRTIHALVAIGGLTLAHATIAQTQPPTECGQWQPLVDGLAGGFPTAGGNRISEMVVFDAGDGPMLYVAGNFETILDPVHGEVRAVGFARLNGDRWEPLPGLDAPGLEPDGRGITLEVWDDGTGEALYVGGQFTRIAGMETGAVARWDGASWSSLGEGLSYRVIDLHPHRFDDGEMLVAGGEFVAPGTTELIAGVQRWDGSRWSTVGDNGPRDGSVYKLASYAGGLFASGTYIRLGEDLGGGIAHFDGDAWSVPAGPGQSVRSQEFWPLEVAEWQGRSVLLAGGRFAILQDEDIIAGHLTQWDGTRWTAVIDDDRRISQVLDVTVFDDGRGASLFVAGNRITDSSGVGVVRDGVLRPMQPGINDSAWELFVFDDGSGPALLVGGGFRSFSGGPSYLVRWQPGERCALDLTGDCLADVYDFLELQNLFAAGDPAADFDGDGVLTIFDLLAYQTAFDAGCP
ncbi:MAG: GC-type dockerin domain-anchored protein [Phycisphaerales bacterium]